MTWTWGSVRALECSNPTEILYLECSWTVRKDGVKACGECSENSDELKKRKYNTRERMYPEMNRMELTGHQVMSCGNYSNGDSDRPRLEYFCHKNI